MGHAHDVCAKVPKNCVSSLYRLTEAVKERSTYPELMADGHLWYGLAGLVLVAATAPPAAYAVSEPDAALR